MTTLRRYLLIPIGLALLAIAVSAVTPGPLTNLFNLRGKTDENGYLLVSALAGGTTPGPLTALANLRGKTDENGYLMVAFTGAQTFTDITVTGSCNGCNGTDFIIQEEGTPLTARAILNFISGNLTAADDAGNTRTNVTLTGTPTWTTTATQAAISNSPDGTSTFLYNGSADASVVDLVMHTSGNDWQNIRGFVSAGTLAAPTNAWSSDALSINYWGYVNGGWHQLTSIDLKGLGTPATNAAFGNIVFTMNSGSSLATTKTITFDQLGVITPQGYKSSDGTAGATTTCTILGLTSITVKNGLITACS